ncbi:MAG: RluA family pseudouridine synthase [Phycisphaerales bacterium]|nr:RluA family pseudouridine synthase [Phycisphaerales bacterium]
MNQPSIFKDGFRVVHAQDDFVVVEKASGLLSVPGIGAHNADCLATRVAAVFPGARNVHRLDQHTSGLIVMALNAQSHRALSMLFEARRVTKSYHAIAFGHPEQDAGEINLPLRKEALGSARQMVCHELGKASVTRWKVEALLDHVPTSVATSSQPCRCTRFRLQPLTGRSHQLRVHLLALGQPILGDDLYAPDEVKTFATRLCLHASELAWDNYAFTAAHPFH